MDETLDALITRIDDAMNKVQDLHPTKFTIDDMDGELAAMALIRVLPDDYSAFKSALKLLPKFDYVTVKEAMILEQQNHAPCL
jgi:hypothetical protein